MQIYSKNNKNCFFSLISWPIFILFVLSDRARWRLQNLYTKFWNSLIMLIYANLQSPGRDPGVQSAFLNTKIKKYIFSPFPGHEIFFFWPVENCTTWNLRYLMLRDAGWALRHWRSCLCWELQVDNCFGLPHHSIALVNDSSIIFTQRLRANKAWGGDIVHIQWLAPPPPFPMLCLLRSFRRLCIHVLIGFWDRTSTRAADKMRTRRGIQLCKSAFIPQPLRIFLKGSAHCLYPFRIDA